MRWYYAGALYKDPAATLEDLREAVTILEDMGRITHNVFGRSHRNAVGIERKLRHARAALAARESPPPGSA
jgi:hypothetical protein